jgi:hypothetical protein
MKQGLLLDGIHMARYKFSIDPRIEGSTPVFSNPTNPSLSLTDYTMMAA